MKDGDYSFEYSSNIDLHNTSSAEILKKNGIDQRNRVPNTYSCQTEESEDGNKSKSEGEDNICI